MQYIFLASKKTFKIRMWTNIYIRNRKLNEEIMLNPFRDNFSGSLIICKADRVFCRVDR